MTQPNPVAALNTLPANEVCDLAIAPPRYREAFRPRHSFGQPSLLDQPREQTELDLEYASMRSTMSAARMLVFALAVEFVACMGAGLYLVATGRY